MVSIVLGLAPPRGWGVTVGFDLNTKNDAYASKKRMLVVGPTLMLDVPGFLNLSLLALEESNAPQGVSRYTYETHAAFEADGARRCRSPRCRCRSRATRCTSRPRAPTSSAAPRHRRRTST